MSFTISDEPIYDFGVHMIHVEQDDGTSWSFIPFDDQLARVIEPTGDRHIVVLGAQAKLAIFDVPARQKTFEIARLRSGTYLQARSYSPTRQSMFVADGQLRELKLDGSEDRTHQVPDLYSIHKMGAREDGCLVLFASGKRALNSVVIYNPVCGTATYQPWPEYRSATFFGPSYTHLRWFSPDGRWALRPHFGSIVRVRPSIVQPLAKLLGRKDPLGQHPDLLYDGRAQYGITLDLFRTEPFGLVSRLFTRLLTAEQIACNRLRSGWSAPICELGQSVIDNAADQLDWREWDGKSQMLFANYDEPDPVRKKELEARDFHINFLLNGIEHVRWADDSQSLMTLFTDGRMRTIWVDGRIGPLGDPEPRESLRPPMRRILPILQALKMESETTIRWRERSPEAASEAVSELAAVVDKGLECLVRHDRLAFTFASKQEELDERAFFDWVRSLGKNASVVIVPLRDLFISYGRQIGAIKIRSEQLMGAFREGTGEEIERLNHRAALADAALALATLDPDAGDVLQPWFEHVDQEHDEFASHQVFPEIARTSRFASDSSKRFGLWFILHQSQMLRYDLREVGLLSALRADWTPTHFAKCAADLLIDGTGRSKGLVPETAAHLLDFLEDQFWDLAAKRELSARLGLG